MKKDFFKQFEHALLTKEMTSTIGGGYPPGSGGGGAGPGSGKCCSGYCEPTCTTVGAWYENYAIRVDQGCMISCRLSSGCNYFC